MLEKYIFPRHHRAKNLEQSVDLKWPMNAEAIRFVFFFNSRGCSLNTVHTVEAWRHHNYILWKSNPDWTTLLNLALQSGQEKSGYRHDGHVYHCTCIDTVQYTHTCSQSRPIPWSWPSYLLILAIRGGIFRPSYLLILAIRGGIFRPSYLLILTFWGSIFRPMLSSNFDYPWRYFQTQLSSNFGYRKRYFQTQLSSNFGYQRWYFQTQLSSNSICQRRYFQTRLSSNFGYPRRYFQTRLSSKWRFF